MFDNYKCPVCKSEKIEHKQVLGHTIIYGCGSNVEPLHEYWVCKSCGVMFDVEPQRR